MSLTVMNKKLKTFLLFSLCGLILSWLVTRPEASSMKISLEYFPAVENFGNRKEARTFLLANFDVTSLGVAHDCQRCFACYATEEEADDKPRQLRIANDRLSQLFQEFDQAGITYQKRFFG